MAVPVGAPPRLDPITPLRSATVVLFGRRLLGPLDCAGVLPVGVEGSQNGYANMIEQAHLKPFLNRLETVFR